MRLAPLLALVLVLTGLGQALALGRMASAQTVEVCTDAGPATLTLDPQGTPMAAAHDCLACLLPALASPAEPQTAAEPPPRFSRLSPAGPDGDDTGIVPARLARGPPRSA